MGATHSTPPIESTVKILLLGLTGSGKSYTLQLERGLETLPAHMPTRVESTLVDKGVTVVDVGGLFRFQWQRLVAASDCDAPVAGVVFVVDAIGSQVLHDVRLRIRDALQARRMPDQLDVDLLAGHAREHTDALAQAASYLADIDVELAAGIPIAVVYRRLVRQPAEECERHAQRLHAQLGLCNMERRPLKTFVSLRRAMLWILSIATATATDAAAAATP